MTEKSNSIYDLFQRVETEGVINNVEVKPVTYVENENNDQYGIFSTKALNAKEILISVPYHLCISLDAVFQSKLSCIFQSDEFSGLISYPDEVMAIGIMSALQLDLPWSLHVSTMPKYINSTIFWEDEALKKLSPTSIYHLTNMMKSQISNDWENIHFPLTIKYPDLLGEATIETYKWALSMIYSRAVGFARRGKYVRCIPPILDMANHFCYYGKEAADSFNYSETDDSIRLLSINNKEAGEECFAIYGPYPNSKLLFTYGFVIQNNIHNVIDLWTRITPSTLNYEIKNHILNSNKLTSVQTYDFEGTIRAGYISSSLLSTVRIIQCDEQEIESGAYQNTFNGKMISIRNELSTYTSLKALISSRIKLFSLEVKFLI